MKRLARLSLLSVCLVWLAGASACGSNEETEEDPEGECQVNADCPGDDNVCDLLTNECSKGTEPRDTGVQEDTGPTDPDTGVDEDTHEPDPDTEGSEDTETADTMEATDTRESTDTRDSVDTESSEDTAPDEDTAPEQDTAPEDTGSADTGTSEDTAPSDISDSGMDASDTQSDTDDGGSDGGTDAGQPTYSGCSFDSDCSGYLECNTNVANGRCEDPRTKCSSNSDCSSSQVCLYGRCADDCSFSTCSRSGLTCETFSSGSRSASFCIDRCDTFSGSGTSSCGEDTQCQPFFGSDEGLCRGVGKNDTGDSCEMDFGPDACQEGNLCTNNRGEKTCTKLCSSSGNPGCGTDEYCNEAFAYDRSDTEVTDPAGICRTDCGGLDSTNNNVCSGTKACQPDSATHGYCTESGTADSGQDCGDPGSPYCKVENWCIASTTTDRGICRSMCNPSKSQANNNCNSSQACLELESNFGLCLEMCSNTGTTGGSNSCPPERPYCGALSSSANTTPSTSGLCFESAP